MKEINYKWEYISNENKTVFKVIRNPNFNEQGDDPFAFLGSIIEHEDNPLVMHKGK